MFSLPSVADDPEFREKELKSSKFPSNVSRDILLESYTLFMLTFFSFVREWAGVIYFVLELCYFPRNSKKNVGSLLGDDIIFLKKNILQQLYPGSETCCTLRQT